MLDYAHVVSATLRKIAPGFFGFWAGAHYGSANSIPRRLQGGDLRRGTCRRHVRRNGNTFGARPEARPSTLDMIAGVFVPVLEGQLGDPGFIEFFQSFTDHSLGLFFGRPGQGKIERSEARRARLSAMPLSPGPRARRRKKTL